MLASPALRYCAIVAGTILWDAGAVLQKTAVDAMPDPRLKVGLLASSPRWMAGLLVTGIGWGLYVFGLQAVGVAAARAVTGGSYVVLALFSVLFLRSRLRLPEWIAVTLVTAGILLLGRTEPGGAVPGTAAPAAARVWEGLGMIAVTCAALLALTRAGPRVSRLVPPFALYAGLSGLLSSAGDMMVRLILAGPAPVLFGACAAGLIVLYLAGFYMLSRAYRSGTMVAGVVLSDFSARLGAMALGAVALGEPLLGAVGSGYERGAGFLLVLCGSLLLGRFSTSAREVARA